MRWLALLLVPTVAAAEPASDKSGTVATELAIGVTALGMGLSGVGAARHDHTIELAGAVVQLIGPSAGHLYADEGLHAVGMFALRGAALFTLLYGVTDVQRPIDIPRCSLDLPCGGTSEDHHGRGEALMAIGGTVLVVATVYDIVDAHRAVARERHVRVAPVVAPGSLGIGVSGAF